MSRAKAMVTAIAVAGAAVVAAAQPVAAAGPPAPVFQDRTVVAFSGLSFLTVADVNEDGRPDLVGAKQSSSSHLVIALASGPAGSFAPPTDTPLNDNQISEHPLVADLDGDGHLDVLLGLGPAGFVWELGNGDGTFQAMQSSTTPIHQPAVGDVVGTSDPDLVALVGGVPTAFEGDGSGGFTATTTTFPATGAVRDILVDDFDGDGHDDVATSQWTGTPVPPNPPSAVSTFHANGDGTFDPAETHNVIGTLNELDAGDVDGDGNLDLVVANPQLSAKAGFFTLLGQGNGSFAAPVLQTIGHGPSEIELTDVNGDGDLDALLLDNAQDLTLVAPGNGDGTFSEARSIAYEAGWSVQDLSYADLNGDSVPDIVNVTTAGGGRPTGVNVLPGRADHTFAGTAAATTASTKAQAIGDLTGDGHPDLITTRLNSGDTVGVFANDGQGRLHPVVGSAFPSGITALATGRLDADTDADVVAVGSKGMAVGLSQGNGSFTSITTISSDLTLLSPVVADLTGDGKQDIVVGDGSGAIEVRAGSGTGTFAAPVKHAIGTGLLKVAVGDLDDDGDLDLIGLRSSPAGVAVLRNNGSGTFTAPVTTALSATPQFVATGDLDGDGNLDVAATGGTGSNARFLPLYGNGTGALVAGAAVVLPESPITGTATATALTLADFNGDGRDDGLVDGLRFVLSDCAGSTSTAIATSDQREAPSVRADAVDMDGDDVLDLVGGVGRGDGVVRLGVAAPALGSSAPAAPFDSCRAFVDQVHRDLLQRPPTAAELNTDAAGLATGILTRGGLVAQIRTSADHTTNVDPVARLYRAYFLRSPDPGGLDYWVAKRRGGANLISISNQFARSNEFKTKYGSLSNTAFVDLVYRNVLGRPGDPSGRTFWINRLNTKKATRGQVMLNFSDSSEYRTKQAADIDTGVLYAWLLRRRPTTSESDAAVAALHGGESVAQLATDLLDRAEYATRVHAN